MRIAIGMISHETNTFCAGLTEIEHFQAREWRHGADIINSHRGVRDDLGGMIEAAERLGVELVPTFSAQTEPSGTISRAAFERMRDELLAGLKAADPVDAICLTLHGAGAAQGADDLEGELLGAVRSVVGSTMPIFVTLDLHGNLTQTMVQHATALLGCHLYPHTDSYERGQEAVEMAVRTVNGDIKPVTALATRPMMIPPSTTNLGAAKAINDLCWEWEAGPGLLDVAFFHGFPHTDIPNMTITVVAVADGDLARAKEAAEAVAQRIWETRDDFLADLPAPADAIQQALAAPERPVVIAEVSDNSGGGAPADGTHLLRAMVEANLSEAAFGFICDAAAAEQAHAAGVGVTREFTLGGHSDPGLHGDPLTVTAYVKCLTDGQFLLQTPMGRGSSVNLGKMARLQVGGLDIVVGSERTQTLDPELFLLHGIDVSRYKIIGLKSQQHFRAGFDDVAGKIIRTDPPGITTSTLTNLPFERVTRPIWPLDRDVAQTN